MPVKKPLEDLILSEIAKYHDQRIEIKLDVFHQICGRLGLDEHRLTELLPHLKEVLSKDIWHNQVH
jgi:hypothetical protein